MKQPKAILKQKFMFVFLFLVNARKVEHMHHKKFCSLIHFLLCCARNNILLQNKNIILKRIWSLMWSICSGIHSIQGRSFLLNMFEYLHQYTRDRVQF